VVVVTARGWGLFAAMSVIWGIPYLLIKVPHQLAHRAADRRRAHHRRGAGPADRW
jgi:hypothetical protein